MESVMLGGAYDGGGLFQ